MAPGGSDLERLTIKPLRARIVPLLEMDQPEVVEAGAKVFGVPQLPAEGERCLPVALGADVIPVQVVKVAQVPEGHGLAPPVHTLSVEREPLVQVTLGFLRLPQARMDDPDVLVRLGQPELVAQPLADIDAGSMA